MRLPSSRAGSRGRFQSSDAMRDELSHALVEALFELEVLPTDEDAQVLSLYAVMDDLEAAIRRTEAMDRGRQLQTA